MIKTYLYFDTEKKRILPLLAEIDESNRYVRFNNEQEAFWKTHLNASYEEIWNAKKNEPVVYEPYVAPEPTLEESKAEALKELSQLSLEILGSHVSEYQLVNARLSLDAEEYDKIYDDDKSQDIIDIYLEVGKQCRTLYYEAKSAVMACENNEQVKGVKDEYNDRYEQLRKK